MTVTNHGPSPASVVALTDTWSTTIATRNLGLLAIQIPGAVTLTRRHE
jgi:hypothetical protein